MKYTIYTDGACSGNPGPGGWGAVIFDNENKQKNISGREENTTNNRMELTATIKALEFCQNKEEKQFETALSEVCLNLTRQLAADGEGAETLIVVDVTSARDEGQARRVAKAIVNSPLVKTAIHGRDPKWGRVAMAIGKCGDADINQQDVSIYFGDQEVYPTPASPQKLTELETYLASEEVRITADLGIGDGTFTAYGCDLTDRYVRINADYTT